MPEKEALRGCPTFEAGLGLIAGQQVEGAMDPQVLEAQITATCLELKNDNPKP